MKSILFLLLAISACGSSGPVPTPQTSEVDPNRVTFAEGKVSFVPPRGFTRMSREEIDRKFPSASPPQHAFANEKQTVSVGITFSPANVQEDKLTDLKASLETTFSRMIPGIQWQSKELIELNGIQWVHLRFQSNAVDTEIINDMYATSFQGKGLFISYNSTIHEYEAAKGSLEESRSSIVVKR